MSHRMSTYGFVSSLSNAWVIERLALGLFPELNDRENAAWYDMDAIFGTQSSNTQSDENLEWEAAGICLLVAKRFSILGYMISRSLSRWKCLPRAFVSVRGAKSFCQTSHTAISGNRTPTCIRYIYIYAIVDSWFHRNPRNLWFQTKSSKSHAAVMLCRTRVETRFTYRGTTISVHPDWGSGIIMYVLLGFFLLHCPFSIRKLLSRISVSNRRLLYNRTISS